MDTTTLRFLDEREQKLLADIERASRDLEGVRRAKAAIVENAALDSAVNSDNQARLSIPDMIRVSLAEQFPQGATVSQLFDFFHARWGRDISKAGLSVALSVMKNDGEVKLENQVWFLIKAKPKRKRVRL